MKKKNKEKKPKFTDKGRCSIFTSYYCPHEIFSLAFKLSEYNKRKKETEEACKKLSVDNRVTATMGLEFMAYDMLGFGFSMGYVMGQLYNIKDREHFPILKKLFKAHLVAEERKQKERKLLPYFPREKKGGKP